MQHTNLGKFGINGALFKLGKGNRSIENQIIFFSDAYASQGFILSVSQSVNDMKNCSRYLGKVSKTCLENVNNLVQAFFNPTSPRGWG